MRRYGTRLLSAAGAVLVAALVSALAAGCTPSPAPTDTPSPSRPAASPGTATPAPTPSGPVLVPDGSAEDNLPLFTSVMEQVWAGDDQVKGRAYVDALTAAGFDKEAMQLTRDRTTVDNPADAIQFSVLWEHECLIGQVGPSIKTPTSVILPELPGGGCLIGDTRPIDW